MVAVSVCIPVYKVEKYIEKCARTLFEQTMTDGIEFIFVNDCTPDKSIEVLEKVLEEYPQRKAQTRIIHHEKNRGLVSARNTALKHASGDYIIHCDADDWIDLELYETMYRKALETDADVVCCPIVWKRKTTSKMIPAIADTPAEYVKKNVGAHLNHLVTKLYRKEIALDDSVKIPDSIFMCEDLFCNLLMLEKCQKIAFVRNVYYYYRVRPDSGSNSLTIGHFEDLKYIADFLEAKNAEYFSSIILYLRAVMMLCALLSLYHLPGRKELFCELWDSISLRDKLKIILFGKYTFRGKCALAVALISKQLVFHLMKFVKV
jgi:glycosyltransferase involved in cell wall biosynthesis